MQTSVIREKFLAFFEKKGHKIEPSSSLVPHNDATLLFTNAGMVQFKDVFLGLEQRAYTKAVSIQRCVRAGGKHNDLENVGYTARHHTFFEMLGNFSFGDYFKREAINFAWQFLTQELGLPAEKLWITVYQKDEEAANIWLKELGVSAERFSRCGDADNFWSMGDTGPCGPCSEIFYDHGPSIPGGPPGSADADGDRYIEIWNLVFMQFNRNAAGDLQPLPKPSVDTGMGLERIAAVMQKVHSNYHIDVFQALIKSAALITQTQDLENRSLRVIADHIRSSAFLIMDGVLPANEGRGYVLRRIIRRAIRHGHKLAMSQVFFHKLLPALIETMGVAYPTLVAQQPTIAAVLLQEEEQFARTVELGLKLLETELQNLTGQVLPGETAFRLYDTYGFPLDLTADIGKERGFEVDVAGFNQAMEEQRKRARSASHFSQAGQRLHIESSTSFCGYEQLKSSAKILSLYHENAALLKINVGMEAVVVLDATPFYAESGGQAADLGFLRGPQGVFKIQDVQKAGRGFVHYGVVSEGYFEINQIVAAEVDPDVRLATALNHSATHLLHAALKEILGTHVQQKGSLVNASRLRFDFSHSQGVSYAALQAIEARVNQEIRKNTAIVTEVMTLQEANLVGAVALFGEKYEDKVRVLTMGGGFSKELCGGTHASRTGDIGLFKILAESGIAAGIRRIEACTGEVAYKRAVLQEETLAHLSETLKCTPENLLEKILQLQQKLKQQEKEAAKAMAALSQSRIEDLTTQAQDIQGTKVLALEVQAADHQTLRQMVDEFKQKLQKGVVVLGAIHANKVLLVAGVTKDCIPLLHAGDIIKQVAIKVGGQGGGRADFAQAGGPDVHALKDALAAVAPWISALINP